MIVPAISLPPLSPWNVQWYGYLPALAKVCENLSPALSTSDLNEPSSASTMCRPASLSHSTVAPTATVTVFGVNRKLLILIVATTAGVATPDRLTRALMIDVI